MWTIFKLASGRYEVYKEVDGNSVMSYPETFGTPEEANAKVAVLNAGDEPEPVDGKVQQAVKKPVDSVQPPAADPAPAPTTAPATAADPSASADAPKSGSDADPSASPASATGTPASDASPEAQPGAGQSADPASTDNGTGAPAAEPAA